MTFISTTGALPLRPQDLSLSRLPYRSGAGSRLAHAHPVGFGSRGGAQVASQRYLILRSGPDQFTTTRRQGRREKSC